MRCALLLAAIAAVAMANPLPPPSSVTCRQGSSRDGGAVWPVEVTSIVPATVYVADAGVLNVNPVGISGPVSVNITDAGAPLNVNPHGVSVTSSPILFVQDAGTLNVNPVGVASLPLVYVADAGVLNVNPVGISGQVGINIMDAGAPINVNPVNQGGTWSVRAVGNAGAVFDAASAGTVPANALSIGLEARSTAPTAATDGQLRRASGDLAGNTASVWPLAWTCNLNGLAASLTQCQAAPAAGYSLYVTSVIARTTTTTAGTMAIRAGTGSNCGTGTTGVWPDPGKSSPSSTVTLPISTALPINWTFGGFKLAAANALCVIGAATNTTDITITGFTAP